MPLRMYRQPHPNRIDKEGNPTGLERTDTRLTAYNGTGIHCYGTLQVPTAWTPLDRGEPTRRSKLKWYVADTPGPAILGLPTINKLGLITMHCAVTVQPTKPIKSTKDLREQFPDRFEGIGKFPGTYKIHLKENAEPRIHPPRKCPIAMRPKVKEELEKMKKLGVIKPVDEPMDWVNSLAYSWKESGALRICLDPKDLNANIRRDHHRVPTVDEISHEFN